MPVQKALLGIGEPALVAEDLKRDEPFSEMILCPIFLLLLFYYKQIMISTPILMKGYFNRYWPQFRTI